MRAGNILYGLVFLAGAGVYAAMLLWTLPAITEAAGGLMPFDMRPFGYTHTEALNFLAALTPDGLALYLGPQAWLDRAYPALLGLFLAWSFLRLGPERCRVWFWSWRRWLGPGSTIWRTCASATCCWPDPREPPRRWHRRRRWRLC